MREVIFKIDQELSRITIKLVREEIHQLSVWEKPVKLFICPSFSTVFRKIDWFGSLP